MAEYIEREATLNVLRNLGSRDYRREKGTIADAMKMIMHPHYTPSADVVEVRHGYWVNVNDFGGGNCFASCSVCGTQHKAENPTVLKAFQRHCRWCGAKMDGKEKDNEQNRDVR